MAEGVAEGFAEVLGGPADDMKLRFKRDVKICPAFLLPPTHPVLLAAYQYYGSVAAARASGWLLPGQASAIREISWDCPSDPQSVGYAVSGRAWFEEQTFGLNAFDAAGRQVFAMQGRGKRFDDRDFAVWRQASRAEHSTSEHTGAIGALAYASPEAVGLRRLLNSA